MGSSLPSILYDGGSLKSLQRTHLCPLVPVVGYSSRKEKNVSVKKAGRSVVKVEGKKRPNAEL